jgi:predicted helicase
MSKPLIQQYYNQLDRSFDFSKSKNEETIKSYFWMLLNDYAHRQNYEIVREVTTMGTKGAKVRPDGILKNLWGIEIGLWESKDEKDDIEDEIDAKQKKGYPFTNILFEDSATAILFQRGEEVMRQPMRDEAALDKIIKEFVSFKNETIYKFEDAIEKFKADIPVIVETLRKRIEEVGNKNVAYIKARDTFLELCQAEINPAFTLADVREMMIQHILTSDIFNKIFDDAEFHKHNTIAAELEKLISTLFTYSERRNLLGSIEHYYDTINATAAGIADHHEKQKFLKVLYENFYKVYNPKAADRLGVVYTPNEIVKFMIESTTYLLDKHFGKTLSDKNVEILDPATGTGTFITDIIDHIPKQHLAYKYKNELHSNEVAILPYYVSNLNIEFTFKQKMGYYEEFTNSCFVDTLDNTGALAYIGKQHSLFGLSSENAERIKRQNSKKISVIIGNPPYNANQQNENENNKNREYPQVDKRIKETFIKNSTAQKTKVYDMYARFYRWAMDRVDKNGIICFITNNSFINARTFDGFRKVVQDEFDYAYIINLGGNIRELSGKDGIFLNEEHTIFGVSAAVGIAMMFLRKKKTQEKNKCAINYIHPCDIRATRLEKLEWLRANSFNQISFTHIIPDKNNNWINLTDNDWEKFIPTANKNVKFGTSKEAIFKTYSTGINSGRDEWVIDLDDKNLSNKMQFYIKEYSEVLNGSTINNKIKWSRNLKNKLSRAKAESFDPDKIIIHCYRPFVKEKLYNSRIFVDERSNTDELFGITNLLVNQAIAITGPNSEKPFLSLIVDKIGDYHFVSAGASSQFLPLYRYTSTGERIDNITDWGLQQFKDHYKIVSRVIKPKKGPIDYSGSIITKEDIFYYAYAVLHNPPYRKKYELNLKREFPRIPFYDNFFQWRDWGKQLMDLHINYETVKPYDLQLHTHATKAETKKQKEIFSRVEEPEALYARQPKIKVKLKADKEAGIIEIDELTFLSGIPKEAWQYKLGNRSALEWILDQYKEKKPTDPTIAEKFNTYRFADYKDKVIDLLKRVCRVSVETVRVVREMETIDSYSS